MSTIELEDSRIIDQIPRTYNLLEKFEETINKNLPKNLRTLIMFVGKYRNKYINVLETPYPTDYPPWGPENAKILYDVTGINRNEFSSVVMGIRGHNNYIDTYLKDKDGYILANMIVRWLIANKKTQELAVMQHYVGYSHYWAVFRRYFKVYKPKPAVMMYTINDMSYKNSLKAAGSVDKWLYTGVVDSYESYMDKLMKCSDYDLWYINEKIKAKFDGYMKNLYREQEKNEKAGNRVYVSADSVDDVIIDNTSGVSDIVALAETYTTQFYAEPINENAIRSAKTDSSITERDLRNTILLIADDSKSINDVKSFYQSLLYIFFNDTQYTNRDIGTNRFYIEMQKLYKPGNTHDSNRITIRDTLDKWLTAGSATYRTTKRIDTASKFRKAVYDYFIFKIMQER